MFDPLKVRANRFGSDRLNAWDDVIYAVTVWAYGAAIALFLLNPSNIRGAIPSIPLFASGIAGFAVFAALRCVEIAVLKLIDLRIASPATGTSS